MPRRARIAFAGAGAGVALLVLTWLCAFHLGAGRQLDQSVFRGFAGLKRPRVDSVANFLASLCDPKPFMCFAALILLVALVRRRSRMALAVVAVLLGANATTQLLKPLLAEPRPHWLLGGLPAISPISWPSGHATAAMSLALCAVLVAPARWRPAAATLGAAFAVAVSYSFLTLGWHFPSDVLGGFLVAGVWTLLAVGVLFTVQAAGLPRPELPRPLPLPHALAAPAVGLAAAAGFTVLVVLARPHQVVSYARAHEAFVLGAAVIAGLGLAVATAVMLTVRR